MEHFDVLSSGQVVGRIYRRSGVPDDRNPWLWSILTLARPGRTMNGLAATMEEVNWRSLRPGTGTLVEGENAAPNARGKRGEEAHSAAFR